MEKCLACKRGVKLFSKQGKDLIYQCLNCGFGFTKSSDRQKKHYHRDENYIRQEEQFANIFKKRTQIIQKFYPQPGRVLEIGSSTGLMLQILKKLGWQVLGIEISPKAAEFAKKRGVPTIMTHFETTKLTEEYFDIIILNHTLEHLENPVKVLGKVNTVLKDGGVLFIDVPNFGGLSARILRGKWSYLLPEEHKWHFTLNSLKIILQRNNFQVVYSESASGIWDYQNPYLEIWQALTGFKKRFFPDILTALPTLIISKLNQGSGLIIVAQKT